MALKSIEYLFDESADLPDRLYVGPNGCAAVALDEFPAKSLFHVMIAIRTPDAVRSGSRLPWFRLPREIRRVAHDLVDLTQGHLYENLDYKPAMITRVESGRSVIEPHMHLIVDGDPSTLWEPGRFGSPDVRLGPERMREIASEIGFSAVAAHADQILGDVNWLPLGRV